MAKPKKKFSLSYDELSLFASNLVVTLNRDVADLTPRGLDQLTIDAFAVIENAFEVLLPDEYYLGQLMTAVDAKDALRATVTQDIQLVSGFFEQKWGVSSGEYRSLRIKNLQNKGDDSFIRISRTVVEVATENLATLTPLGLTQAIIDTLESDAQLFEDALNDVVDKKNTRDLKAVERVNKANELYNYVSEYCKIGKLVYEHSDPAKFDDYLIYPKSVHLPLKVDGMLWTNSTATVSWNNQQNIIEFQLQFAPDMPEPIFSTIYEGLDTSFMYNPGGPDNYLFRCRSRNSDGWGPWSDILVVYRV